MKKNILIGTIVPLLYFLMNNIVLFQFEALNSVLIMVLPALPGVLLMFMLIRKSMKEYFESLAGCFCISFVVMIIYMFSGIDLMLYTAITGYEEFSMGDGLIMVFTMGCYLASCLVGAIVAGIVTYLKKRKTTRTIEQ